jgi:hypothetical protein
MKLLSRITTQIGSAFDDFLLTAARTQFGRYTGPPRERSRLLDEASAFYRQPSLLAGDGFFPAPERPEVVEHRVRRLDQGEVVDLTFPSRFEPHWDAIRREYLAHAENRTAYVRMLRHATPRPALICLHGFGGGRWFLEERSFAAKWLHSIGLDVCLFVLPFHQQRSPRPGPPLWPSTHVARLNEGFAHAMHDLRALVKWLQLRGSPSVSACGQSLGGYTTALLATLEPLAFAGLMIPVASFGDLFWHHGTGSPERAAAEADGITLERMKAAMEVVTPLSRPPRVSPERVLVLEAAGDRIAPRAHSAWLADHFRATRVAFAGGHVLQIGRARAFRAVARKLAELQVIPPRAS